jgi:hypothetical protein
VELLAWIAPYLYGAAEDSGINAIVKGLCFPQPQFSGVINLKRRGMGGADVIVMKPALARPQTLGPVGDL